MADRPHIVMVITDHFRGDCLSRLGHPAAETPHVDSISREGAVFTRAYTPCPSCIAARRSLMTGQTPYSQGVVGFKAGIPWDYDVTMAGELTRAGYQTINIGKTHFEPGRKHLGFEQLILPGEHGEWLAQQPGEHGDKLVHGVHGNSWMGRPNHLPEHLMEETWLTSRAGEFLRKRDPSRPFFLCLSFNGPHPPWCPPQVYYDQFIGRDLPKPVEGEWSKKHADEAGYPLDVDSWRGRIPDHLNHRARAAYFAYLAYLDTQVGRLVHMLRRHALLNDTFMLFTSDHGEMLGDHNLWRKTYGYEGSARIPCVVRFPQGAEWTRNQEIEQVVGWEDLMPTFLDLAGAEIPETVEGQSLLPLLRGETEGWRDYYHGEHSPCYHPENANQFLTDGKWKYIWNPITGEEQLFHMEVDPDECVDLAGEAEHVEMLLVWRGRMVKELEGRDEGLSDGEKLIPGPVPVQRGGDPNDVHLGYIGT
ncbi:MAG: arylsulfatase [bacterium]|nr:arylsulfatase [bacterium]